jgi:hypothetical protein
MVPPPKVFALNTHFFCKECMDLNVKFKEAQYKGAYVFTKHLLKVHKVTLYDYWQKRIEKWHVPW